jgi:hypothetical protein
MRARTAVAGCALMVVSMVGCESSASRQVVPLLTTIGMPLTPPTLVPLRVVTRSTAVHDPLLMRNSDAAYTDVESALGYAISSASVPWANQHRTAAGSQEGWQLFVELTSADARFDEGRVIFTVTVRATLLARAGNVYIAQTNASCRQGGIAPPDKGGPVLYKCMMEIGRDLNGWLDGVDLDAVAAEH